MHGKPTRPRDVVLQVCDVVKEFARPVGRLGRREPFKAVDHVSFEVGAGEIACLLGESGCGKTTLARMVMHLVKPTSGTILLDGEPLGARRGGIRLRTATRNARRPPENGRSHAPRALRRKAQMVYQNPFDCLDPSRTVRDLLAEPLKIWHPGLTREERAARIARALDECSLDERCLPKRPGEFSGGQLQRLAIARVLLVEPKLLIADEIVSALDVPVQNQVLQLLLDKREEHGFSVLFITHDLSVARKVADHVLVMRHGALVADGPAHDVLDHPEDPYVRMLAQSVFAFG